MSTPLLPLPPPQHQLTSPSSAASPVASSESPMPASNGRDSSDSDAGYANMSKQSNTTEPTSNLLTSTVNDGSDSPSESGSGEGKSNSSRPARSAGVSGSGTGSGSDDATPTPDGPWKSRNLHVSEVSPVLNSEDFALLFEEFGPLESHKLMVDIKTGNSRGFGFVLFEKAEDAATAVAALQGKKVHGQLLHIAPAKETNTIAVRLSPRVSMRQLPASFEAADVRKLLEPLQPLQVDVYPDGGVLAKVAHITFDGINTAKGVARKWNNDRRFLSLAVPSAPSLGESKGTIVPPSTLVTITASTPPPPAGRSYRPLQVKIVPDGEPFPAPRQPPQQQQQQQSLVHAAVQRTATVNHQQHQQQRSSSSSSAAAAPGVIDAAALAHLHHQYQQQQQAAAAAAAAGFMPMPFPAGAAPLVMPPGYMPSTMPLPPQQQQLPPPMPMMFAPVPMAPPQQTVGMPSPFAGPAAFAPPPTFSASATAAGVPSSQPAAMPMPGAFAAPGSFTSAPAPPLQTAPLAGSNGATPPVAFQPLPAGAAPFPAGPFAAGPPPPQGAFAAPRAPQQQ